MTKKMILLNASPRKNKNTAQILESVMWNRPASLVGGFQGHSRIRP